MASGSTVEVVTTSVVDTVAVVTVDDVRTVWTVVTTVWVLGVTDACVVTVVVGVGAVMVVGKTPRQLQALEYFAAPEQALA